MGRDNNITRGWPLAAKLAHYSRLNEATGEKHGLAKLTAGAVKAIRADERRYKAIAAEYGVSPTLVFNVKKRLAWRHVP